MASPLQFTSENGNRFQMAGAGGCEPAASCTQQQVHRNGRCACVQEGLLKELNPG